MSRIRFYFCGFITQLDILNMWSEYDFSSNLLQFLSNAPKQLNTVFSNASELKNDKNIHHELMIVLAFMKQKFISSGEYLNFDSMVKMGRYRRLLLGNRQSPFLFRHVASSTCSQSLSIISAMCFKFMKRNFRRASFLPFRQYSAVLPSS